MSGDVPPAAHVLARGGTWMLPFDGRWHDVEARAPLGLAPFVSFRLCHANEVLGAPAPARCSQHTAGGSGGTLAGA
eukprot:273402-Chlamydomonas_euryale.AAC.1